MRRSTMNILLLLLFIFCLWCHVESTVADNKCSVKWFFHICGGELANINNYCLRKYAFICAGGGNRKRNGIDDGLPQETDPNAVNGERRDIQEARVGEGREDEGWGSGGGEGGRGDRDSYRGSREGDDDDVRSEFNDLRRQQSDEVELVDIGNHRRVHSPRSAQIDSAIDRLRSLLGTTDLQDVDDRGEDEGKRKEEEQDTPKRSLIGRDRNYVLNETQTLLSKILSDIEGRLDQPPVPRSVSRE